jgi:hypothetical protein
MADEGLDDCTHYEGKDGYALVDGATYESMRRNLAIIEDGYYHLQRENERLRATLKALLDLDEIKYSSHGAVMSAAKLVEE